MDSINKNQPEKNHEDLTSVKAVEQIKTIVKQAQSCFFCTAVTLGPSDGSRPMSVQRVDSHKNAELAQDPSVTLYFQGSAHSDFLLLKGNASVSKDKAMIKALWEPILKTWFTEGIDDPRITVIRFAPQTGYYWDTKHGAAVAGVKMLIGAAIGKTLPIEVMLTV